MSRITSARRRPPPRGRLALALSGAVLLALVGMMMLGRRSQEPPASPTPHLPPTAAAPAPVPTDLPPTPAPAPTETPTPEPVPATVSGSTWVDLSGLSGRERVTPTVGPTEPETTPALPDCVTVASSSARQSTAAWGQVLVDIEIVNHCGRKLGQLDVWLEVAGFRNGAVVQSVRGHPFQDLDDGDTAGVTIGLPGSLDWYDRIEVRVLPGAE